MSFKLEDNSDEVKMAMDKILNKWLEAASLVVESQAKALAPVDTGSLKTSISHKVDEVRKEATVGAAEDYSIYVEFGTGLYAENGNGRKDGWAYKDEMGKVHFTRGQKPQPYLRPAFKNNKKNIQNLLSKYLKEIR